MLVLTCMPCIWNVLKWCGRCPAGVWSPLWSPISLILCRPVLYSSAFMTRLRVDDCLCTRQDFAIIQIASSSQFESERFLKSQKPVSRRSAVFPFGPNKRLEKLNNIRGVILNCWTFRFEFSGNFFQRNFSDSRVKFGCVTLVSVDFSAASRVRHRSTPRANPALCAYMYKTLTSNFL